jgi:diacylglycerol kinase (ATP)
MNIDGREEARRVLSVVVSNGAYFGGGMRIAPKADLKDRRLDVVTIGDVGKAELLQVFPRVYKGTHITHPKVRMEKAERITIECDKRILLQADGELLGEGPVTFQIIPAALNVAA